MEKDKIEAIKKLRSATHLSMNECKKALESQNWNVEKALQYFKDELSHVLAENKYGRPTNEGGIFVEQINNQIFYVIILCETSFVADNESFIKMGRNIVELIAKDGNKNFSEETKTQIDNLITQRAAIMGENIHIKEMNVLSDDHLGHYLHGGDCGVLFSTVSFNKEPNNDTLYKQMCQHVVAFIPENNETLLNQNWILDQSKKVKDILLDNSVQLKNFNLFSV